MASCLSGDTSLASCMSDKANQYVCWTYVPYPPGRKSLLTRVETPLHTWYFFACSCFTRFVWNSFKISRVCNSNACFCGSDSEMYQNGDTNKNTRKHASFDNIFRRFRNNGDFLGVPGYWLSRLSKYLP